MYIMYIYIYNVYIYKHTHTHTHKKPGSANTHTQKKPVSATNCVFLLSDEQHPIAPATLNSREVITYI
jgi:hypothetical protein